MLRIDWFRLHPNSLILFSKPIGLNATTITWTTTQVVQIQYESTLTATSHDYTLGAPHEQTHIAQQCYHSQLQNGLVCFHLPRNIIQIHNNVTWDRQYDLKYSTIFPHILTKCEKHHGIFYEIMSVPQNTVMNLNNVMSQWTSLQIYSYTYESLAHEGQAA